MNPVKPNELIFKNGIMEHIYSVYTRNINNQLFYFVKQYEIFTELKDTPRVLTEYGMHRDFFKACSLANIYEESVINELCSQVYLPCSPAKVISFDKAKQNSHSLLRTTQNFLSKLRLAGLNYFL